MRLINQSYEILGTPTSLEEAWSFVAMAARNCYQSEKTKLDESEEQFCRRILLKHPDDLECDHMSPFEFGIIYLYCPNGQMYNKYRKNQYSRAIYYEDVDDLKGITPHLYITTNLRVIIENGWEDDLKYAGPPTKYHILACCFKFDTSIHCYKDLTRHRTLSFCIESTRFCKYSSNKFGNGLTFIRHPRLSNYTNEQLCIDSEGYWDSISYAKLLNPPSRDITLFLEGLNNDEHTYLALMREGWTAQEAASKLPQDTKGTVMMCGYVDNLNHMFRLRAEECSGPVLPQLGEIIKPMYVDYLIWQDAMNLTLSDSFNETN